MGFIIQGMTSTTIDPINGDGEAAYFIFVSEPNLPVFVSFSSSSLTNGIDNIALTASVAGNSESAQKDAILLTEGTEVITSQDGTYYFWGGGTAALSQAQPFGIYTGTFTLSITY
jgi:hypothetical protein